MSEEKWLLAAAIIIVAYLIFHHHRQQATLENIVTNADGSIPINKSSAKATQKYELGAGFGTNTGATISTCVN